MSSNTSTTILPGHHILLRLASGLVKSVQIEKDGNVTAGRIGTFSANALLHHPYGLTYEVSGRDLVILPPRTMQEVVDTDANNELITDDQLVQPLTTDEILALKESGLHASDMIKKQIEQHANYELKTEYSKEKYKKRKEAKYSKSFTTIPPTLFNVCEYWFTKDPSRVRDLRMDSLSQMLNLASVRPGGRYLAVDDASGILIAGILERLGGDGCLVTVCDTESPPTYPFMVNMNFSKENLSPLSSLNWATAEPEWTPVSAPLDVPEETIRSDRQRQRLQKRKLAHDKLEATRQELLAGHFDGLLVATQYDIFSVIDKLEPYLTGSASIVAHSPFAQHLVDVQMKMRADPGHRYLSPSLTECWLRRYQVLPGRTHPEMTSSGTGGYLLQTYKIYDDPSASSIMVSRRNKKTSNKAASSTTLPSDVSI